MYAWFVLIVRSAPAMLDTPIPMYEVDIARVDQAASETPFLEASFELLKEAAGLTALAAGTYDGVLRGDD